MPNQFLSPEGDLENYFVSEYQLIDQYIGDQLWTWGRNSYAQLGDNNIFTRSTPVTTFAGGTNWSRIAIRNSNALFSAAIKTDGTLWVWGRNSSAQLGINNNTNRSTPVTTFAGGTDWKQVSLGDSCTVAIKTDGTLWTWGSNNYGQLGINIAGFSNGRSTPVTTFAGGTNWKQVSCLSTSVAAIKTDGTLWTWGNNQQGRLGRLNALPFAMTPITTFAGGTNWADTATTNPEDLYTISASGGSGNCSGAIKTDGTLWVWGANTYAHLGTNDATTKSTPVTTFAGGTNWKQLSCGSSIGAIKTDGTLWVWGRNNYRQLGTNDTTNKSTPVTTFAGGTNWKQISVSVGFNQFTAAIKTDGTLWTWGFNSTGQLGDNTLLTRSTPVTTFAGGTNWKQVSCGNIHIAAVKTDGTLWVWGSSNYAVLGTNDATNRSTPVTTFAGGTDWKQVSTGISNTAAIKTDGTLWVWGRNNYAQLGINDISSANKSTPVTTFSGGTNWKQVACGGSHIAAVKTDGTLWVWGRNSYFQLGTNDSIIKSTPVTTFAGGTNWKQVSSGNSHTLVLRDDGTNKELFCFGNNSQIRLGNNFNSISIEKVGGDNWNKVICGSNHVVAIKTDGTLWVWGSNQNGQLGINENQQTIEQSKSTPVTTFAGGTNWMQLGSGTDHTAAIKTDGTLWTWGSNTNGKLGRLNAVNVRSTPITTFAGGTNWADTATTDPEDLYTISTGQGQSGAIKTDGTLWVWGSNNQLELGIINNINISPAPRITPVTTFSGGTNWKMISMGTTNSVAIKTDGTLWTWGFSGTQLGINNSSFGPTTTPVTTFAGGTDWKQASIGRDHIAAIKTDGTLWVWGNNGFNQLGLGIDDTSNKLTPVTTFSGGTNWKQVSSNNLHTAAIKTDGTLWIWGSNQNGQLGKIDANIRRSTPVTTFSGGTNWADTATTNPEDLYTISCGRHSFSGAIKTDGTLWVWGRNTSAQLGRNDKISLVTPVTTFAGGTNWITISLKNINSAAIKTDGTLWVWGGNSNAQLGTNDITNKSTPVTTFAGGTDWKQVSLGEAHTAAIKTDGTLWTWGRNANAQLGINIAGANVGRSTPVTTFAGGTNWKQVSSGYNHTAAIKTDGTLWTWGYASVTLGTLGINVAARGGRTTPVTTFAGGTNWKQVSCSQDNGNSHTAAIKTDGTLWVWGNNTYAVLGTNDATNKLTPVTTFSGGTNWQQVACGGSHIAAVKTDGTLWVWGRNTYGQLGDNTLLTRSTPVTTFAGGTNWKQVFSGSFGTFALRDDGTNKELFCFGSNTQIQLGLNVHNAIPNKIDDNTNWKQVSAGVNFNLAIKTDGTLWSWGYNSQGQLGTNDLTLKPTPVTTFAGGTNWKQCSSSNNNAIFSASTKTDGTLWTWGRNNYGQLGVNDIIDRSTPVTTFAGGTNWRQVSCGAVNTLALKGDGISNELFVFGRSSYKNSDPLGSKFTTFIPGVIEGTNWKYTTLGNSCSGAIKTDGTLWVWGINTYAQLGINNANTMFTPVTLFSGGTNWKQISMGSNTIAVKYGISPDLPLS